MQCPNCGAEVREGAAFCGSCGEAIPQGVPAAAATTEAPAATAPVPVAAQPAADEADYARQMAEYERQKAAYDQQQYAQQQAAYQQQQAQYTAEYGQPAVPPKKSKTGLIIAIVVILVLLLGGCGVGGFFAYKAFKDYADEASTVIDPDASDTDDGDAAAGNLLDSYATADEAVMAQLEASGVGDWVYQLTDEGDGYATYWAGPPNSEYVDEIYVEQNADGTWSVIEVSSIDYGGDASGGSSSEATAEAVLVVDQHLSYVMNDQGLEAQALTIDPFHSDSASAAVSGGGFDYYEITGATEEADGTVWVQTTQSWYGSVENWEYWVVPTEAGYFIADIRIM